MKKLNLFSDLWSSVVGSRKDNGSTRYRLVIVSLSSRYRVWHDKFYRLAAVLCLLLTICSGNAWGETWTKITSAPLSWDGEYILVRETSSTTGKVWTGIDAAYCEVDATISSGSISSTPSGAVTLIIAAVTGGYSIKVNGGTNNNKYTYGTSGDNAMNFNASAQVNTITYDETNSCVDIVNNTSHIRYASNRFRYYKSSSYKAQDIVQLYKKNGGPYTVTLKDNNSTLTEASVGAGVVLPSRTGCTDYTFVGWTQSWDDEQTEWTTDAPVIIPAGSYVPISNAQFYPVYTKNGFSKYLQVALDAAITAGKYLISTGTYTMSGSGNAGTSFSPGTTEATSYEYTVALDNGDLTILGPDGKYVGWSSSTTLAFSTSTPSTTSYKWKYDATGIQCQGATTRYLQANGTTDFRCYVTGGTTTYLYKRIDTYYISVPSCCDKNVTLSGGSPTNGTVSFSPVSVVPTCSSTASDRQATMTITPNAGYQLDNFSVGGTISPTGTSPAVVTDNNSSDAQNITLTFAQNANGIYTTTATFSEMKVTSWTWTKGGGAIPATVDVYVGQKIQLDVSMSPSGVLASHKNNTSYTYDVNSTYIGNPTRAGAYFTFEGKAAVASTTITLTHNDDTSTPKAFAQTVNVSVKALPSVTFTDIVHDETFGAVTATVSVDKLTVTTTKKTPTHADVDDPGDSYNSCERQHLHLVGWIDKDWADEHPDATHSEIVVATEYFYAPNADIDLVANNGKTFYAVWAKEVTP